MRRLLLLCALTSASLTPLGAAEEDVDAIVTRVAARVVEWYGRAQNIVSTEEVAITPLGFDMSAAGATRRLTNELRVAWDAPVEGGALPQPTVLRELRTVNGRPPRSGDEPGCMDPKPVSAEPLTMLLPEDRRMFRFKHAGVTRVDGRAALMIDYRGVSYGEPEVVWDEDCVSITLPGRARGRIWVDAATYDVLRLDESMVGLFDLDVPREQQRRGAARSMVIERASSSIRYQRVQFVDPPETLMVPARVDTLTVIRGNGTIRTRITHRFSGHRRFISDVRILP